MRQVCMFRVFFERIGGNFVTVTALLTLIGYYEQGLISRRQNKKKGVFPPVRTMNVICYT